jgi:hypothetical protein
MCVVMTPETTFKLSSTLVHSCAMVPADWKQRLGGGSGTELPPIAQPPSQGGTENRRAVHFACSVKRRAQHRLIWSDCLRTKLMLGLGLLRGPPRTY